MYACPLPPLHSALLPPLLPAAPPKARRTSPKAHNLKIGHRRSGGHLGESNLIISYAPPLHNAFLPPPLPAARDTKAGRTYPKPNNLKTNAGRRREGWGFEVGELLCTYTRLLDYTTLH